ncbi:hypothetical protein A2773_01985 [Candidatus Gottesmanbacteria bacterium RIFCSPHIGHO2_01_FULL_39_10]|uniref:YprB ribonuclease H-like domain-containing protein n=1 Tax=Candidatus Gottesmanbacteria bacterium RIFCSPHIGHO2_01_FULL_39_10 TaxID=1798375 RepID=A0A1F5ZPJ7_9BACT|nr:MAG: hypothetical protein A2773_01985 [Candidatus Gottesmanbacteria bacterium RIFCSPHIGHO2_01_FULL_39_10]
MNVTASKLYDYFQCPHRVWRDIYGPQEEKSHETNPFVELLWEKGVLREKMVVKSLGRLLDLCFGDNEERFRKALEAMKTGSPLIYHGYICWENLAGEPDLLRKNDDGTYFPIDIKSGRGMEGVDEAEGEVGKPKKHYAAQLALYAEILIQLGFASKHIGEIFDIDSKEVIYDLDLPMGVKNKQSWWQMYQDVKNETALLVENKRKNDPALRGVCKLCPWYGSCKKWCVDREDLSTEFSLGRSKRDTLQQDLNISTVGELGRIDIPSLLEQKAKDKEFLSGLAASSLGTLKKRAQVLHSTKRPIVYSPISFPQKPYELYFDIEDDPTQGFVYLHGVYERFQGKARFLPFVAKNNTPEAEKQAWKEFWQYIHSLPKDGYSSYYYSKHERTTYRRMQQQYPDVASVEEVEQFFDPTHAVDLYYDCILKNTDWPLYSYSLKEIAQYLGFNWRDKTPSGALSIQWFNEYLEDKDPAKLHRIIEYNEDDCKATMVIKDYLTQPIKE